MVVGDPCPAGLRRAGDLAHGAHKGDIGVGADREQVSARGGSSRQSVKKAVPRSRTAVVTGPSCPGLKPMSGRESGGAARARSRRAVETARTARDRVPRGRRSLGRPEDVALVADHRLVPAGKSSSPPRAATPS